MCGIAPAFSTLNLALVNWQQRVERLETADSCASWLPSSNRVTKLGIADKQCRRITCKEKDGKGWKRVGAKENVSIIFTLGTPHAQGVRGMPRMKDGRWRRQ